MPKLRDGTKHQPWRAGEIVPAMGGPQTPNPPGPLNENWIAASLLRDRPSHVTGHAMLRRISLSSFGRLDKSTHPVLIPLSDRVGEVRSVILHPLGGGLGQYAGLVSYMARRGAVYGIRAMGIYPGEQPDYTIVDMVKRYISLLRDFPARPNLLIGWSLGGVLAWEMALRLAEDGHAPSVVLIDSSPEPWPISGNSHRALREMVLHKATAQLGAGVLESVSRTVDAHIETRKGYRVARCYAGRVLLVSCGKKGDNQVRAWGKLASDLTIKNVHCDHFEIFSRQNFPYLSGFIGEFLAG